MWLRIIAFKEQIKAILDLVLQFKSTLNENEVMDLPTFSVTHFYNVPC